MEYTAIAGFIAKYVMGFPWLVFFISAHIIISTIAHLKVGDFKISEWPGFLTQWIMFIVGIVMVNGVVSVSSTLASAWILLPVVGGLQALMYGIYFSYYLDNIFKHMNMLGWHTPPGLIEAIKGMTDKIKGTFTGGTNQ